MKNEVKAAIAKEKAATTGKTGTTHTADAGKEVVIDITLPLGRPIDPTSERQKRLAQFEAKKSTEGGLHRGRPKDPNSANAKKRAEREARIKQLQDEAIAKAKAAGFKPILAGAAENNVDIDLKNVKHVDANEIINADDVAAVIAE